MANIVVDASVLIAVVTNEPQKANLIRLTQNMNLIAPHSIHWEIGKAFSAMIKRHRVSIEDAVQAIESYQRIPIRFAEIELVEAMKLANSLNIYTYDAYLIRCSIKYKSPLLSLDQSLVAYAKMINAQVIEVAE